MRLPKPTKPYRLKEYKFNLVVTVLILSILGIMVIGSAKQSVQNKQIMGLVIGLVAMVIISLIDYVWVLNFYWILYGLNIIMLILTLVIGDTVNGAKRWINLGFTSVQPSELSKLFLILFFAKFLMDHQEDINSMRTIITSVILLIPTLVLILAQPNLSTTITIAVVFCVVMYLAGLSYKFIGTVLAIAIPVAVIFISIIVQPNQPFLEPYQQKRVLAWLEPEKYASDEAYQQNNSLMAIGSGQ